MFNIALYGKVRCSFKSFEQCILEILRAFGVSQWYQWYTNIVQGFTNGTIGNTICTNGNDNGTIGSPNGTIGAIGKSMVPLVANGTIGKISNGTIGRTPNGANICFSDHGNC